MKASYNKSIVRALAFALALVCVFALCACSRGNKPVNNGSADAEKIVTAPPLDPERDDGAAADSFVLKAADLSAGYYMFIAGADTEITAKASGSAGNWSIYVLEDKPESESAIKDSAIVDLKGDGMIPVKKGQYVYVFVSGATGMGATLTLRGEGLPED